MLQVGMYELTEITAPDGYTLKEESIVFTIENDGTVQVSSAFTITLASPPSNTLTQLLVVPKSIPIVFPIINHLSYSLTLTIAGLITLSL